MLPTLNLITTSEASLDESRELSLRVERGLWYSSSSWEIVTSRSPEITGSKEDQERDVIATVTNYVRTKSDTTTKRKRDNMTLFRSREIFIHPKSPQVTSGCPLSTLLGMREFPHTIQSRSSLKPRNLSIIERMIQFLPVSFSLLGAVPFPRVFHSWGGLARSRGRLL